MCRFICCFLAYTALIWSPLHTAEAGSLLLRDPQPKDPIQVSQHPQYFIDRVKRSIAKHDVEPLVAIVGKQHVDGLILALNAVWGQESFAIDPSLDGLYTVYEELRHYATRFESHTGFIALRDQTEIAASNLDREILRHQLRAYSFPIITVGLGERSDEHLKLAAEMANNFANYLVDSLEIGHLKTVDNGLRTIRKHLALLPRDFWSKAHFTRKDLDRLFQIAMLSLKDISAQHGLDMAMVLDSVSSSWVSSTRKDGELTLALRLPDQAPLQWTWRVTEDAQNWQYTFLHPFLEEDVPVSLGDWMNDLRE